MADWLEAQIEKAARAMGEELGVHSVCTVHKDGRVTSGLKYQEGRMSALAAMRRALVRGGSTAEVIAGADEHWSAEFETRLGASPSSPIWVSYATRCRDAVREARKRLDVFVAWPRFVREARRELTNAPGPERLPRTDTPAYESPGVYMGVCCRAAARASDVAPGPLIPKNREWGETEMSTTFTRGGFREHVIYHPLSPSSPSPAALRDSHAPPRAFTQQ